jgi:polar amino acid transport system permease protein
MIREFSIVFAHFDRILLGLTNTLLLAAIAIVTSLLLGICLAACLMSRSALVTGMVRAYCDIMRCVPFLLLAYLVYFGLPSLGLRFDNWTSGLCALILYNAAYMAELMRGVWVSLPRAPVEAGRAYGFHGFRLFRRIILPPILLAGVPMLGNQAIQVIKDTAFLSIIAVPELTHAASAIQSMYYVPFGAFVVAVACYWLLCVSVEFGVGRVEAAAEARR